MEVNKVYCMDNLDDKTIESIKRLYGEENVELIEVEEEVD